MSGVAATLALVLLRGVRRGGRDLRLWFARRALCYAHLWELAEARDHWCRMFQVKDWYYHLRRFDAMTSVVRCVETIGRHAVPFHLQRVVFWSTVQQMHLVRWRRLAPHFNQSYSRYCPLPAATPKRRSARLSMKRNLRKRIKK